MLTYEDYIFIMKIEQDLFQKKAFDSPIVEVNMKNKKGTIVMLVALAIMFVASILPFQDVPDTVKMVVSTPPKPISTVFGIAALVFGIIAFFVTMIGQKKAVLIAGFLSTVLMLIMIFTNKADKKGLNFEADNKIGYTMCWVSVFVMAAATLFSYLTTPRYEKRK